MVLTIGPGKVSGVTGSEAAEAVEQAAVVTADAVGSAPSVTSVTSDTSAPVAGPGRGGGYQPMIRDMPQGERPRERLRDYGPKLLSNTELIAILLRTGIQGENVLAMSNRLLTHFKGLDGLGRSTFAELCAERGLSEAKTCQLMAALELGRRFISLAPQDRAVINSPQDVANLLQAEMAALEQEHLRVLLLNTRNQVLRTEEVYVGNVNSSIVRPAEVFRPAVRDNAPSIIIVHNHPSGDPMPSPEDVNITRELVAVGKLLSIELLDHLVIGSGGRYVSLNEKKLGFG
jgi:DNA repair protein RadC